MSRRETYLLGLALLAVAAVAVVYWQTRPGPEFGTAAPYFYELDAGAITNVSIAHDGNTQSFAWDATTESWVFAGSREPVDPERWGGMPVLLSGPRIERTLPSVDDLTPYGLDPPRTVVTIGLDEGTDFIVLIGGRTPNGLDSYVMQSGSDQLLLIDGSWAEVIQRMVIEPPHLDATSTP